MKCLETNKICEANNQKCKTCKLDDCKEALKILETQEQREERHAINRIKAQLPKSCRKCTILKILNARAGKVYCPYMIKERCILE